MLGKIIAIILLLTLTSCADVPNPSKKPVFGLEYVKQGYDYVGHDYYHFYFVRMDLYNGYWYHHYIILDIHTLEEYNNFYSYSEIYIRFPI